MTKRQLLEDARHGRGQLGESGDDEPVLVLAARDELAPAVVRHLAVERAFRGRTEDARRAHLLAEQMEHWQREHGIARWIP